MARLDPSSERVVVRLVYDGPAWAGKTTTLRSLARSLGTTLHSGEEADGRTLQFDWVDYVGGRFRGLPIHCQIVSVPGQRVLEKRRLAILATADAVVFVADSRRSQQAENSRSFETLKLALAAGSPPVATVVQANKRDLPDALDLEALRARLGADDSIAMTPSVAETGDGVRETFVLAVRLALDRVRALWDGDGMPRDATPLAGASELLATLGEEVAPPPSPAAGSNGAGPDAVAALERPGRGPRRPDAAVPPGLVWPPVLGRVAVHESAREPADLRRNARGDWSADSAGWLVASPFEALFSDLEAGRQALIQWARWHSANAERLSPSRALVLAEAAPGAWRLWQIVRRAPTNRPALDEIVRLEEHEIGGRLLDLVELRMRAERSLVDSGRFARVALGDLALSERGEPIFASLADFPPPDPPPAPPRERSDAELAREILANEIAPALHRELRETPARFVAVLSSLDRAATLPGHREWAKQLRDALLHS